AARQVEGVLERGFLHRAAQRSVHRAFVLGRPILLETGGAVADVGRAVTHDRGVAGGLQLHVVADRAVIRPLQRAGPLAAGAGSPTVAVSLPSGIASGARLTSAAAGGVGVGSAATGSLVAAAGSGVVGATAMEVSSAGRKADGGIAGVRASRSRSSFAGGSWLDDGDAGATATGSLAGGTSAWATACGTASRGVSSGVDRAATDAGGNGCGCGRGSSGTGGGDSAATLSGAIVAGAPTCSAMAGGLAAAGAAVFGKA